MPKKIKVLLAGQVKGWFMDRAQREAKSRGLEIVGCMAGALVSTHDASGTKFLVNGKDLFSYDIIHLFTVQKHRALWYAAAAAAAEQGTVILDANCIATPMHEQSVSYQLARQSELGLPFPATTITSSWRQAIKTLRASKWPIVVKTLNSRKGRGVTLVRHWFDFIKFSWAQRHQSSFAFRQFIKADGDYRITVIGGVAQSAVLRRGQKGEWRNNLSLGGSGEAIPLTNIPEVIEIAEQAAVAFDFDLAGVDIIVAKTGEPYILEINRTPQLTGSERLTGLNLVGKVLDLYVSKYKKSK